MIIELKDEEIKKGAAPGYLEELMMEESAKHDYQMGGM